ncbi:MAG: ScyD/ScyE family protein [Chloroflexi bacterium]|nr:ScyD/ScyE family protein [Chloroflexota bacterium]
MQHQDPYHAARVAAAALAGTLCLSAGAAAASPSTAPQPPAVVVSGLTNPRGFTWSDDGTLIVALAGNGGEQEGVLSAGPSTIFGGRTSSIVRIEDGCPVAVAAGLPSGIYRGADWVWGAMDVTFLDGQLYALLGGGGEDFGDAAFPNGVYRVNDDGSVTMIANLSSWLGDRPPKEVAPDYNSDGSLFDMEGGAGALWISEAVGGRLLKVTPDGTIGLVADLSEGHRVPTGVAIAPDGGAYVGFETAAPWTDGSSRVVHVAEDGAITDVWTGLTAVTDVVLGPDGALYAAEMATDNITNIRPGTGRVVRQDGMDGLEVIADGLDFPSYLGFAPDGSLLVGSPAIGADDGQGTIARISGGAGTGSDPRPAQMCVPAAS